MKYDIDIISPLIRKFCGIPDSTTISENTAFEDDLGITGDDGQELLQFIENELGVSFAGGDGSITDAFNLEQDEYLFHAEGLSFFSMFQKQNVRRTRVKDIVLALKKVQSKRD